jgi:hypothetical protein
VDTTAIAGVYKYHGLQKRPHPKEPEPGRSLTCNHPSHYNYLTIPIGMMKNIILPFTLLIVICSGIPAIAGGIHDGRSGGYEPIPDINDPYIQEIGRWAVEEHDKQANDNLKFLKVLSGMHQTVEGENYQVLIQVVKADGNDGKYNAEVFDQVWTKTRKLTSFGPIN